MGKESEINVGFREREKSRERESKGINALRKREEREGGPRYI